MACYFVDRVADQEWQCQRENSGNYVHDPTTQQSWPMSRQVGDQALQISQTLSPVLRPMIEQLA
jgi:hypothetical protein